METIDGIPCGNPKSKTVVKSFYEGEIICEDQVKLLQKTLTVDYCRVAESDMDKSKSKPASVVAFESRCPLSFGDESTCPQNKNAVWFCCSCQFQVKELVN